MTLKCDSKAAAAANSLNLKLLKRQGHCEATQHLDATDRLAVVPCGHLVHLVSKNGLPLRGAEHKDAVLQG